MAEEVIAIKSLNETRDKVINGFASLVMLMDVIQADEVYSEYKKETKWHKTQK